MNWIIVALGGAAGTVARHAVNMLFGHVLERSVPYTTAAVNLAGSLAIGLLAGLVASGRVHMTPAARTFVFVGILGGFTTFSSFALDTFTLGHGGEHTLAFWNVAGQVGFGLLAVWAGYRIGLWRRGLVGRARQANVSSSTASTASQAIALMATSVTRLTISRTPIQPCERSSSTSCSHHRSPASQPRLRTSVIYGLPSNYRTPQESCRGYRQES